jgi:predicted nucleic acid-binding protein
MADECFFLDVNVPMYAAGEEHPYKAACVWLMTEIAEGRITVAIDTEIVQDVLYRYGAVGRWVIGVRMASDLLVIVPTVYPVAVPDVRRSIELFKQYAEQGVKARDLIHAAVMLNHGLTQIISADAHFDRVEGIVRLDPQTVFSEYSKTPMEV